MQVFNSIETKTKQHCFQFKIEAFVKMISIKNLLNIILKEKETKPLNFLK